MNASNVLDSFERPTDGFHAPVDEPEPRRTFPFEFRGSGAEYFRIWIVNLLLTILTLGIFIFFVIVAWFLTGMFAGWQAVRHIRRLEPGITNRQAWGVSAGWGCGAIIAAFVMIFLLGILSSLFGR